MRPMWTYCIKVTEEHPNMQMGWETIKTGALTAKRLVRLLKRQKNLKVTVTKERTSFAFQIYNNEVIVERQRVP